LDIEDQTHANVAIPKLLCKASLRYCEKSTSLRSKPRKSFVAIDSAYSLASLMLSRRHVRLDVPPPQVRPAVIRPRKGAMYTAFALQRSCSTHGGYRSL